MDTQAIEKPHRSHRVTFGQPVRVVPIGGPPRAYRVFAGNLSRDGIFLKMAEPFEAGTRLALSLEARGRVLPFAQGEVVWRANAEPEKHRIAGLGVRFTGFLHPRADELVDYLVANIDTGEPLELAPEVPYWKRRPVRAVAIAAGIVGLLAGGLFALLTHETEVADPAAAEEVVTAPTPAAPTPVAQQAAVPVPAGTAPTAAIEAAPPFQPKPLKAPVAAKVPRLPELDLRAGAPAPEVPSKPMEALDRTLPMPTSAVSAIRLVEKGERVDMTFRFEGNAAVTEVFRMSKPDRLVVDLSGRAPSKSHRVEVTGGAIKAVRIGKGEKGTRLVFDLNAPLKVTERQGNRVRLSH
ncbi:MAG: AMIN domain-containing protein [Myxococcaceae bacterium]|nr:AMIN domain-containing protein [Myxococcaceae bacterium]